MAKYRNCDLVITLLYLLSFLFTNTQADDVILSISVDNSIEVYLDGNTIGTHSGWHIPATFNLGASPGILAFRAHNSGGPASVLASLTNGMITEAWEWRCTTSEPGGTLSWKAGGYDDSSWAVATEYGQNGASPWGLISGVDASAHYIWTSDNNAVGYIYCRIRIGVEVLGTCDNTIWLYADGIEYTDTGSTPSTSWTVSDYYMLPRGTEVFGIKCTNSGGPAGILASVYNGPVTDRYEWKCTFAHQSNFDWTYLAYNDYSWSIPHSFGQHGVSPWGNLQNPYPVSWDAEWIWGSSQTTGSSSTAYCRVSLETPVTCWTHYTDRNSVWGLISGGARTDNRPNTFYFGEYGDNVEGCAAACARESHCKAYTLHLTTFPSSSWAGGCYGRSDFSSTLQQEVEVDCGVKVDCDYVPQTGDTVTACSGVPNGNYQSSVNCNQYIECYYGQMTTHTCPENQYWDDVNFRCNFETTTCTDACSVGPCQHGGTCSYSGNSYTCTCPINVLGDNCETVTIPTGQCVSDCSGVANGNYQSCSSCSVYATCTDGVLSDNNACPSNTFWDDVVGECVENSVTCQDYCLTDSRVQCRSNADGQTNCENVGCCWDTSESINCFHSTESPVATDPSVTCGIPLADRVDCGYSGISREECLGYGCCYYTRDNGPWCYDSAVPRTVDVGETVSDCEGLANGQFQSETNCNSYVSCLNGVLFTATCPPNQFWDDASKTCGTTTSTCSDVCTDQPCLNGGVCGTSDRVTYSCACAEGFTGETCRFIDVPTGTPISSCTNILDGTYESATNCNAYIECSGETMTTRTCAAGQFYDDASGACGATTSTCEDDCTPAFPCQNGATCSDEGDSYACSCVQGYEGTDCEYLTVDTGTALTSCTDVANGNYMSTTNCNEYVVCTGESLSRSNCPANEFWDDSSESCESTVSASLCTDACTDVPCQNGATCNYVGDTYSCTCAGDYSGTNCESIFIPSGNPISSCTQVFDGSYHSSANCNEYIECSSETMATQNCPAGQFFDDNTDNCATSTGTCEDACTDDPCHHGVCLYTQEPYFCQCNDGYEGTDCEYLTVETGTALTSCTDVANGNYMSTTNCNEYVVCTGESLSRSNCPENQFWDDSAESCQATVDAGLCTDACTDVPCLNGATCNYVGDTYSCTCAGDYSGTNCESLFIPSGDSISSCTQVFDGSYHSPPNCNEYVTCSSESMDTLNCAAGQFFDDARGTCGTTTTTCTDACTPGPCQNGATCTYDEESNYVCQCTAEYEGNECQYTVIPTGQSISSCTDIIDGSYMSTTNCNEYVVCTGQSLSRSNCPENEFWDDSTESCESTVDASLCTDACTDVPCQNGATCNYVGDTYTCTCAEGFSGTNCELRIIESGQQVSHCTNTVDGTYNSDVNCQHYVTCSDGAMETISCPLTEFFDDDSDHCGTETSTCEDACTLAPCENGGTCLYDTDEESGYTCQCTELFGGTHCELDQVPTGNTIADCDNLVDGNYHKTDANCNEYIECVDQTATDRICDERLFWDDVNKECAETTTTCEDACTPVPCENDGLCVHDDDTEVGYVCECETGWSGDNCETSDDDGNMGVAEHLQAAAGNTAMQVGATAGIIGIVAIVGGIIIVGVRKRKSKKEDEPDPENKGEDDEEKDDWEDKTNDLEKEVEELPPVQLNRPASVQRVQWP